MDKKAQESTERSIKETKEKRQKHYRERKSQERERHYRSRSRSRQNKAEKRQYSNTQAVTAWKGQAKEEQKPEKTHVSCRRCKQNTFSLINRTCSSCGYPKQSRPNYFPVTKQVQVLDLVRQGKLVHNSYAPVMIEVVVNDRMGKRQRIKCCPTDTVLQFKKLISAQIGTRPDKIRLQKANIIFKDHITLQDYEIKDGMGLQMYYD